MSAALGGTGAGGVEGAAPAGGTGAGGVEGAAPAVGRAAASQCLTRAPERG